METEKIKDVSIISLNDKWPYEDIDEKQMKRIALFMGGCLSQQEEFVCEETQATISMTKTSNIHDEPIEKETNIMVASQINQTKDKKKTDTALLHNVQTNPMMNIPRQRNRKFIDKSNAKTIKKKKKSRPNTKLIHQIDLAITSRKRICIAAQTRWLLDDELDDT